MTQSCNSDAFHDAIAAAIERDDDDGAEAQRHLAAGRAIYITDPRYPGQATRLYPDGRRELMKLDVERGVLIVVRALDPIDD
ncbi:hypothetical protein C7414_11718 [Cupriavidus alkaliphilus]|nr:hypothetical protein C7414_11718 [Cupriavidus alkaliphilus]